MTSHFDDQAETPAWAAIRRRLFRRDADKKVLAAIETIATIADEVSMLRRQLAQERKRRAEIWRERNELAEQITAARTYKSGVGELQMSKTGDTFTLWTVLEEQGIAAFEITPSSAHLLADFLRDCGIEACDEVHVHHAAAKDDQ